MFYTSLHPKPFYFLSILFTTDYADLSLDVLSQLIIAQWMNPWTGLLPHPGGHLHWLQFIVKCIHFNSPLYLKQLFVPFSSTSQPKTLHAIILFCSCFRPRVLLRKPLCLKLHLTVNIRSVSSLYLFKNALSTHYRNNCACT